jgi:hypothetical protein
MRGSHRAESCSVADMVLTQSQEEFFEEWAEVLVIGLFIMD